MKVVCLGDSITYGYECFTGNKVFNNYPKLLSEHFGFEVINSGYSGYRVHNVINILEDAVFKHDPDVCIIMLGINDAKGSKYGISISCDKFLDDIDGLIFRIKKFGIKVILLSMTITKNSRVKFFNQRLVQKFNAIDMHKECELFMKKNNIDIDTFIPDSIHLNNKYYKVISDVIIKNWENIC